MKISAKWDKSDERRSRRQGACRRVRAGGRTEPAAPVNHSPVTRVPESGCNLRATPESARANSWSPLVNPPDPMSHGISVWQVDAFTDRPYTGNPAAVCLLENQADDEWMQAVAMEMNLSETSFVRRLDDGFELRWFTPKAEVDLCGHATLATAHALWTEGVVDAAQPIRFHTRSGPLTCTRLGGLIELDFPALPPSETAPPADLIGALGVPVRYLGRTQCDYLAMLDAESDVRAVQPDFRRLCSVATRGVIVTAPSDDDRFDFVSRFFAPKLGIDEDPVCGSAHCSLGPFWGARLGKTELIGHQVSQRRGVIHVRLNGDRVVLGGHAVTVLRGELLQGRLPAQQVRRHR